MLIIILVIKNNQKRLYEQIADEFRFADKTDIFKTQDIDHGRIETRICSVIKTFKFIEDNNWVNLSSIIKVESTREFKNSEKPKETAVKYFIANKIQMPSE